LANSALPSTHLYNSHYVKTHIAALLSVNVSCVKPIQEVGLTQLFHQIKEETPGSQTGVLTP